MGSLTLDRATFISDLMRTLSEVGNKILTQSSTTGAIKMLEILTKEWQYVNTDEVNFETLLHIKEQRKLGTLRGPTSTPQAPVLRVRIKADTEGLPRKCSVKAILWSYGPSYVGKNRFERKEPAPVTGGEPLTQLRRDTYITCADNVEELSEAKADGYRYAVIRCFITRGARVCCRKNHIALKLCVVQTSAQRKEPKSMSGDAVVQAIAPVRTARLSISEKAMCPRYGQKKSITLKRKLNDGCRDREFPPVLGSSPRNGEIRTNKCLKQMATTNPLEPFLSLLPLQSAKLLNHHALSNQFGLSLAQESALQLLGVQSLNQNLLALNPSLFLNNLAIQACLNRSQNTFATGNPTLDIIASLTQGRAAQSRTK